MEVATGSCEKASVRGERGKRTHSAFHVARLAVAAVLTFAVVQCAPTRAQVAPLREQSPGAQNQSGQAQANDSDRPPKQDADAELQTGTALTRKGSFRDAIPHLLAAQTGTANPYAANFNLALCYVGTNQFKKAIQILRDLQISGHDSVDVENLLAQAYMETRNHKRRSHLCRKPHCCHQGMKSFFPSSRMPVRIARIIVSGSRS